MEALSRTQLSTVSEVTVSYRPKIRPSQRPIVKCAKEVYEVLLRFWNADKIELCEQFCVVLLNNRGSVLGIVELSTGGFTGVVGDTKMVFSVALKACACSIVVAHNHPSGNLKPSSQDIKVTNRLVEAGKILEVPVQDLEKPIKLTPFHQITNTKSSSGLGQIYFWRDGVKPFWFIQV